MRLFVALPVPASPAYRLVTEDLLAAAPAARPVPEGAWHITVRFLGEVFDARPVAAAIDAACRGRPALPCVVEGLGTFPNTGFPPDKKARVAWAAVRAPGIDALASALEQATAGFGEPPERRPFVAHVTLARLPNPADLRSLVDRHRRTLFAQGRIDRVVLYRSAAGPSGPRYDEVHAAPLGVPSPPHPLGQP
ncbi:MAG TPA: RNA 2',3'-cyclic phosphodiesterase [Candidatus Thermoplasmatota archaeon]|nr:RNA 2',3'-cyclic phosphodiesterase [Candidatus Thermoplasmatota archaeon]